MRCDAAHKERIFLALVAELAISVTLAAAPLSLLHHGTSPAQEQKKRQKALEKELQSPYRRWLNGPVGYIITPQERAAFLRLTTDTEREQFIEAFWERRNPNPGSPYNEYKEEFYRRIAYANEHYSSGIPGWKTDRGRIYIMYGPPDEITSHPSGGSYTPAPGELPYSGPDASTTMETYPFEDWHYHYIPGIGENVKLEFVDPTLTGEYHLTMNPCEKDAMAEVPGDMTGCQGGVSIGPIWNPTEVIDPSQLGGSSNGSGNSAAVTSTMMPASMDEFNRLDLYAKIFQPPEVKFKDLEAVVTSRLSPDLLPFKVRTDYIKVTNDAVLTPITVQLENRDIEFQNKDGVMHAVLDVYGRITSIGGRVVDTFEQGITADVPRHDFTSYAKQKQVYQRIVPLPPGHYKVSLVIKDDANGHMGSTQIGIDVPQYNDSKLSNSSLILASKIAPLPTSEVGAGPFVIGGTEVRPSVDDVFTPDQTLGIYMQLYNLGVSPKTHRPDASIEYKILKDGKAVLDQTENAATYKDASEQVTIKKQMPVRLLQPGHYTLQIKVTDNIKKQTDDQSANFRVEPAAAGVSHPRQAEARGENGQG
jgi:GWxTD domain-containing protein